MKEHWRICVTLRDGSMVLQRPHFTSVQDCTQHLLDMHQLVMDGERVDFVRDYDEHIYPVWRANQPQRNS